MSPKKCLVIDETVKSSNHAGLLVSDEGSRVPSLLKKGLEYFTESRGGFFAGDTYAKGYYFVE